MVPSPADCHPLRPTAAAGAFGGCRHDTDGEGRDGDNVASVAEISVRASLDRMMPSQSNARTGPSAYYAKTRNNNTATDFERFRASITPG